MKQIFLKEGEKHGLNLKTINPSAFQDEAGASEYFYLEVKVLRVFAMAVALFIRPR